jgi:hypothetical protein
MSRAITNQDLYNALNDFRKEVREMLNPIDAQVKANTRWIDRATGQFTIIMIFVGAGINYLFDMLFPKK